jgi:L-arabinose transport system ATP-binding protein
MTQTSDAPPRGTTVLLAEDLAKGFSGVQALAGVTLEARAGEVLALMGENGAGKSTLLKILSGDQPPDSGRLVLAGKEVTFATPAQARRSGVRVIAQEPEIIPHVSVAENVYVGNLRGRGHRFERSGLRARVAADLDRYGFTADLDPDTPGRDLTPAQRQLVEVLRALTTDPQVLAFDEPTSSLSDREVDVLMALIGRLRDSGVAIVYVSHRLKEVLRISDRIAVLRDGALVGVRVTSATSEQELVRLMVGRDLSQMFSRDRATVPAEGAGRVLLSVRHVSTDDVTDVSLEVRAGEVVGLAGLVGAGRSELVRAVVGDVPIRSGGVWVDGRQLRLRTPADAVRAGIGFAPEERKKDGLILGRTVRDNASLAVLDRLTRLHVVRQRAERTLVQGFVDQLSIRTPSMEQEVRRLSGGNQQKVVLARWLARQPKVLILDEPTRGVDVGAKAEIYAIIDRLAGQGVAVLVISSELPEVLGLADRVLVMQGGRLTGELSRTGATEEKVLALAMADQLTTQGASA